MSAVLERQTLELPSTRLYRSFRFWQTLELLRRSLSHYCLIRYVGRRGSRRTIGAVLIQPATGLGLVRYDMARTGLLPRSKQWRSISEYLDLLQTSFEEGTGPVTVQALEDERQALMEITPRWQHLLSFSTLHTMLGDPETLIEQLSEEKVMSKAVLEEMPRISFGSPSLKVPTVCQFIRELAPSMNAHQLGTAALMLSEQADEDAFGVKVVLMEKMIRLMQYSSHEVTPEQSERFLAACERIPQL